MNQSRSFLLAHSLPIAVLLLAIFFIRAHEVMALPVFNDESLHIRRSEIVWTFENAGTSFTVGKLIGYYWLGAFGFDRLDALHAGRLVYALFILIGAAATYRVGRSLFNHTVGLLALVLYAFAPYLIFYERLILADQLAASLGMLAVWAGIRLARSPTRLNGLVSGAFVSLAVLAKLTAIPFALASLVAIWALGRRGDSPPAGNRWLARIVPRHYWPALLAAYAVNVVSGLPFMLFPLFREVQKEPVLIVGENLFVSSGWHEVFAENVPRLWDMLAGFFGPAAVIVALLLMARLLFRARGPAITLIACALLPWSIILFLSPDPSNRYWLLGMPPVLVLAAAGVWDAADGWIGKRGVLPYAPISTPTQPSPWWARNASGLAALGLIAVWIALVAVPFVWHAWTDPLKLRLPEHDRWEYFEHYSSGYGLVEAARFMPGLPVSEASGRVPVASTTVGCHALRLVLPVDGIVDLSCPFFGWNGEYMDAVAQHVERLLAAESVVYMLVEPDSPFTDLSVIPVHWEEIKTFARPFEGMPVVLYRVTLAAGDQVTVRSHPYGAD